MQNDRHSRYRLIYKGLAIPELMDLGPRGLGSSRSLIKCGRSLTRCQDVRLSQRDVSYLIGLPKPIEDEVRRCAT